MAQSRPKGKREELAVVHWLEELGFKARRGYQSRAEDGAPDVHASRDGVELACEVKLDGKVPQWLYDVIEQAKRAGGDEDITPVMARRSRRERIVILTADDFQRLMLR